jgi:hypothetical protein
MTAVLPSGERRKEVQRRRELDVHIERLLELRQRPQQLVGVGLRAQVHVTRRTAPADDDGARPADEIHRVRCPQAPAELGEQLFDARALDVRAHAARRHA